MRSRRLLSLLPLAITAGGCATVGMVRNLPPDAGRAFPYAASLDSLTAAAQAGFQRLNGWVLTVDHPDSNTRLVIGRTGPTLMNLYGDYLRVRVTRDTGDRATVRILTRAVPLLQSQSPARVPRMFQALDAWLDRTAIGPFPGARVEASAARAGGPVVRGTLRRVTSDSLELAADPGRGKVALALAEVDRLAVSRGSYGHAKAGAILGYLLGSLAGAMLGSRSFPDGIGDLVLGMIVGAAVGAGVGSSIRTEVWSVVPPARR